MADNYSCNLNLDPNASGNMYFRGEWEYCPEYKTGDVVLQNGVMYLCRKPHAGQDPSEDSKGEYWHAITPQISEESTTEGRKILDGGYATTGTNDSYEDTDLANTLDGGFASSRIYIPLI